MTLEELRLEKICFLADLEVGQYGVVEKICTYGAIRRRLRDLGIIEGTCIECAFKSPSKDPVAYQIRGTVIALRNEDAKKIIVSVKNIGGEKSGANK